MEHSSFSLLLSQCRTVPAGVGYADHNLAKVGVEGSNPFARSSFFIGFQSGEVTAAKAASEALS